MKHRRIGFFLALWCLGTWLASAQDDPVGAPGIDLREGGSWRVPFQSVPGNRYRLERSDDLVTWRSVRTITAQSAQSTLTDSRAPMGVGFWRVRALGPSVGGGTDIDEIPPMLARLEASFVQEGQQRALILEVKVTDNVSVARVSILDGMTFLGQATPIGQDRWRFVFDYENESQLSERRFVARADDAAGNAAFSRPLQLSFENTDRFEPINGGELQIGADGTLPPFMFNPGSDSAAGGDRGISIAFPEGGSILTDTRGRPAVAFQAASFGFEEESQLQLLEPLSVTTASTKVLPLESLAFTDVAEAFDVDPQEGIAMELFGQFPVAWKGGQLEGSSMRAPQFEIEIPNFPLPRTSGLAPDLLIDFSGNEPVRLPFSGSFALSGVGEQPPTLNVPESNPLWLTLCPDGRVSLSGRAEVALPNGMRFLADVSLEDPFYRLRIVFEKEESAARDALALALPDVPLITPGAQDIVRLAETYRGFSSAVVSASALGAAEASDGFALPSLIPAGLEAPVTALLDTWGIAGGDQLATLSGYLDQMGKSAASAQSLESVLETAASLYRAKGSALTGSAEAQATLETALDLALLAVENRATLTGGELSLESMNNIVSDLVSMKVAQDQLGEVGAIPGLDALPALLDQLVRQQAAKWVPSAMSLEGLIEGARTIDYLSSSLDLLGLEADLLSQLIAPLLSEGSLRAAEELIESQNAGDFFGVVDALLKSVDLAEIEGRTLNNLSTAALNAIPFELPSDGIALRDLTSQAERWFALSEKLDTNGQVSAELISALTGAIDQSLPGLAQIESLEDLSLIIEAGILRDGLSSANATEWLETELPMLITRAEEIVLGTRQWTELDQLIDRLIQEAPSTDAYLEQAKALLSTYRELAIRLWQEEQARRSTSPVPETDIQLPGDLVIDSAYGEISYHRLTREIHGTFGGTMRLPNFGNSFLTIANASVSSAGAFDLNAFGSMSLPFEDPIATVSIREDAPLHVGYDPEEGLKLRAGTRLEFTNGMAFEGDLTLEDPIYIFRLAATDVRFDLLQLLAGNLPTLPARDQVDDASMGRLVDFYGRLNNQTRLFEPQVGNLVTNGRPASFLGEAASDPASVLQLYLNYLYIESLNPSPNAAVALQVWEKANTLLEGMTAQAEKEFLEFVEIYEEPLVEANDSEPRHLLIDFGEADRPYGGPGPSFDEGFTIDPGPLWNHVDQDNDGGLFFSDGSPAPGIRLDAGAKFVGNPNVDWNYGVGPQYLLGRQEAGLIPFLLLADNLQSDSIDSGRPPSGLAVRIFGLDPGVFRVYALTDSLSLIGQDTRIVQRLTLGLVDTESKVVGSKTRSFYTGGNVFDDFVEAQPNAEGNLVTELIGVEEDHALFLASQTVPQSRGWISGLEIVEILPEIESFTATPAQLDLGESAKLTWKTSAATSLRIDRGVGTVDLEGSTSVTPLVTTRYTLTASNLSGSVSRSVVVSLSESSRRYAKLIESLSQLMEVEKDLADTTDVLAEAMRAEDQEKQRELQDKLDELLKKGARLLVSDSVIDNQALLTNRKVMALAARASFNFAASMQLLGRGDNGLIARTSDLVGRSHNAILGLWTRGNGDINTTKVRSLSASRSEEVAREILDSAGDATLAGNDNVAIRTDLVGALVNNAARRTIIDFGKKPDGSPGALLSEKSFEEINSFLRTMIGYRTSLEMIGGFEGQDALTTTSTAIIERVEAELPKVPAGNWRRRCELLNYWRTGLVLGLQLETPSEFTAALLESLEQMNAEAGPEQRLSEIEAKGLELPLGQSFESYRVPFEARVKKALTGAKTRVESTWTNANIPEATALVEELAQLHRFWKSLRQADAGQSIADDETPPVLMRSLNAEILALTGLSAEESLAFAQYNEAVKGLADTLKPETENVANGEGLEIAQDVEDDLLRDALLDSLYESAQVASLRALSLAGRVNAIDTSETLLGLGLPGALRVDEVFGQIFYNRDTGFIEGSFGGRLTIPETEAFFEISEATVANDGSFTFDAATAGPLPFGGVRVSAAIQAMGSPQSGFTLGGQGSMTVPGENGQGDQTFNVGVGYSQENARMFFAGEAEGAPLRFTDDFLVFGAGTTLEVSTTEPFGKLVLSGDAGLFARGALPNTPSRDDFALYLEGAVLRFENDANGFDLALQEGNLLLPVDAFSASLCPDNSEFSPQSGPTITLTETQPILVRYDENPERVRFTGTLGLQDIGITLPDVEDFRTDICTAQLVFDGESLPAILNVNARGVLPLPSGQAEFRVVDAMWTLDGLPQGLLELENDATLFDADGIQVRLLGEGRNGCPAGSVSITSNGNNVPTFAMSGGISLVLPSEVIASVDGEPLTLTGCGSFTYTQGQTPSLTVDQLSLSGNVQLGGSGGVLASNVDITVRNVSSLFNPDQAGNAPFLIELNGGQLDFPNGVTLALQQGFISQDGSFNLGARASGLTFAGAQAEGDLRVIRSLAGALDVEGNAMVTLTESGRSFNASISYENATKTLAFAAFTENLDLELAEDFVLFDGGVGFAVSGARQAGFLTVTGTFGIVAKPDRLAGTLRMEDYELLLDEASVTLAYDAEGFGVILDDGTLRLPDFFEETICPGNEGLASELSGPAIALNPDNPIQLRYTSTTNQFDFSGDVLFRNIGFEVPGVAGLRLAVCDALLAFENGRPRLVNLNASVEIPLPNEPAFVDILDAEWGLNGFPTGTIALRDDLTLLEQGGFNLYLLGQSEGLCDASTALTITENNGQPVFRIDGGIELTIPAETLSDDAGGTVGALACGGIEIGFEQAPLLDIDVLSVGGETSSFRLGGSNGLLVEGATLTAFDVQNLFNQSAANPFVLSLSGRFQVPDGPGFGLREAEFRFDGSALPKFSIGGADLLLGESFEVIEGLPIQISEASFDFTDQNLPLPDLLNPNNLQIGISASIAIPPETPIVSGQVNDLTVKLVNGVPQMQIDGFGFGIDGFEVPPLSLTGQVYVGGLSGPPENIFFAGQAGGTLNGAGVKALVAFNLRGPIGVCFDVSAGPAGIPLGPTGFLLTGVSGGVSFANSNADPCNFAELINLDDEGRPLEVAADTEEGGEIRVLKEACTWECFAESQARLIKYQEISDHPEAILYSLSEEEGPDFPCPTGVCPPRTMNILCQPHPDRERFPERVIVKFTSLNQSFIDSLRFTPPGQNQETGIREFLEANQLNSASEVGDTVAMALRGAIDEITPRLDAAFLPNADDLNAVIEDTLNTVEANFAAIITTGVQGVLGNNDSVYEAILEAAYAGVPCFDATVKVTGTFSHASVSTFLSGTVGAILSTAGSAGLVGSVNLIGIPVGKMSAFVSATDEVGDPNPSLCGDVNIAVGPLELGSLKALYECDGCITGMFDAFADFGQCLGDEVLNQLFAKVAPEMAGAGTNGLFFLTDTQKSLLIAEIFSNPPELPGLRDCFVAFLQESVGAFNPQITLCGNVQPKIFGLSLGASVVEVQAAADKESFAANFGFSPSYLTSSFIPLFPSVALDQASFGFGVGVPNPDTIIAAGVEGRLSNAQAVADFAAEGLEHVLANSTFAIGYEFEPFGFEGVNAEARVLMPNLTDHPAHPQSSWQRPERVGLPSRKDVLLGALESNLLANPLWTGNGDIDAGTGLGLAFPEGSSERAALQGLSFQDDYFPHGGIIGAARLSMPAAIVDAPPTSLFTLLDETLPPLERLTAGLDFVTTHLLQSSEVGSLAFYTPAPNPPILTDPETGNTLSPGELLTAIMSFDGSAVQAGGLYPLEETFLSGYLEGRLLGVPIANAEVTAYPPDPAAGTEGCFEVLASVPENSWMKGFVDSAALEFIIKQAPPRPINERFQVIEAAMANLINNNASQAAIQQFLVEVLSSLDEEMPKASMEVEVNNLRVPDGLENLISLDGSASAKFVAYSPCFDSTALGDNPLALAKRKGGIAMQARLRLLDLVTIDNAELSVTPGEGVAPALAGLLEAPLLSTGGLTFRDLDLALNTEPAINQPYLSFDGKLDPVTLGSFVSLQPLANAASLEGSFRAVRGAGDAIAVNVAVKPARISTPILGDDLALIVHGATRNADFTFSTEEPWNASLTLEGQLKLRDRNGEVLVAIGTAGQNLSGIVSGNGLEDVAMEITIPTGVRVTTLPDMPHGKTLTIGSNSGAAATLLIEANGRVYFDSGLHEDIGLPGVITASGRLEFGYDPGDREAGFAANVSLLNFGTQDLHVPSTRTVTVSNPGQSQLTVFAATEGSGTFTVTPNTLAVAPGESRALSVRFLPTDGSSETGSLRLQHNGPTSPTVIPLSGVGNARAIYYQSDDLLAFGEHAVGGGANRLVSIANLGQKTLTVSDIVAGAPYTVSPSSLSVPPGEQKSLFVSYRPTSVERNNATITMRSNDRAATHRINLTGTATEERWHLERQGGSNLLDIAMKNSLTGVAVGQSGAFFRYTPLTAGSWTPLSLTNIELRAAAATTNAVWVAGRSGTVLKSTDFQLAEWTPITDPDVIGSGGNQWNAIAVDQFGFITLVGDSGKVVKQFSNAVYNDVSPGDLFGNFNGIAYNGTTGILVGDAGVIRTSSNSGATWTRTPSVSGVNLAGLSLESVAFADNNVAIIVGQGGTILRSINNGASWVKVNQSATSSNLTKVVASGSNVYAVGVNATFLRSTNSGQTWTAEGTGGSGTYQGVAEAEGLVWAVGQSGRIRHRPVTPLESGKLVFEPGILDFGTVPLGQTSFQTVTLRNRGTGPIGVTDIVPSTSELSIADDNFEIPPGGQRTIRVYARPTQEREVDSGVANGNIQLDRSDQATDSFLLTRLRVTNNAWQAIPSPTTDQIRLMRFLTDRIGYIATSENAWRTVDQGKSWEELKPNPPGPIKALQTIEEEGLVFLAGGTVSAPFILWSLDEGDSWKTASLPTGLRNPVNALSFQDGHGFAVCGRVNTNPTANGVVLSTADNGESWQTTKASPSSFFLGNTVHAYNQKSAYVSSGGTLYRTRDTGSAWEETLAFGGAFPITDITMLGASHGWLGGNNGLYRRSVSADATRPSWEAAPLFTTDTIHGFHFEETKNGWCVTNRALFRTTDEGVTWKEDFQARGNNLLVVHGAGGATYAGGTNGTLWKHAPAAAQNLPLGNVPVQVDFGEVMLEQAESRLITVTNIGNVPLEITRASIDPGRETLAFTTTNLNQTLAPGAKASVAVGFTGRPFDEVENELVIDTNAGPLTTILTATGMAAPGILTFDTEPSGIPLSINGKQVSTPASFTLGTGGFSPGDSVSVSVASTATISGLPYQFQQWTPGSTQAFTFTVANESKRYVASFVEEVLATANDHETGHVDDLPAGPWLRVTEANVAIPGLGGFGVDGSLFLSTTEVKASLEAHSVRIPSNPNDFGLFEMTAGSWHFDWERGSHFRMLAEGPGVALLEKPITPPTSMIVSFATNGNFTVGAQSLDALPLIPGVAELGPGGFVFSRTNNVLRLDVGAELRMFPTSNGDFAFRQAANFQAAVGPFTYTLSSADLPVSLLQNNYLDIRRRSNSRVELALGGDDLFSLRARNFDVVLLNQNVGTVSNLSLVDDAFNFTTQPPSQPYQLGPFRLTATSGATVAWDISDAAIQVSLPSTTLRTVGVSEWPSAGITLPAFSIDTSGDFDQTFALPDFTMAGIEMNSGQNADRYLRFYRQGGVLGLRLRDRQDFFLSQMKLGFDIDSTGDVGGFFRGTVNVDTGFFGELEITDVGLSYDGDRPNYQFAGLVGFIGQDFGVEFGSSGPRFRHVICDEDDDSLDDCSPGLFILP